MEAMEDDGSRHRVTWLALEDCRTGQPVWCRWGCWLFLEAHDAAA